MRGPTRPGVESRNDYVELHRTFRDVIKDNTFPNEDDVAESYAAYGKVLKDYALTWGDLLQRDAVVVLGEAGSGKSYEFRHQAEQLEREGKAAFFIELDRLATGPFEQTLSRESRQRLEKWRRGKAIGHFFLDAVDESKLHKTQDFYRALDVLVEQLPSRARGRSRFCISSRITGWNPDADEREVKERLLKNRMLAAKTELLVVQINPLTQEQIKTYAQHRRINPPEPFIAEVARCHAWSFVRRPVDAEDLIQYWLAKGRLGTLAELIEFNIGRNIVPSEKDRNRALAEDRARLGVETLAAATILCKNLRFRCPPGSREDATALEAIDCLPGDWTAEEALRVLSLPILDGANYGCVRFHHRRSAEYLAAQWVRRCMGNGCSLQQLRGLFFEEIQSKWELRASLAPVLAWLCHGNYPWNREVRCWVLQSAPDIHWSHGDPSALDVEYKRELLRELVSRYSERKRLWLDSDRNSLERFSNPGLGPDITKWVQDKALSEDLRIELIRLVWVGELRNCIPDLMHIALDPSESENVRIYALIGLGDLKVSRIVAGPLCRHILDAVSISQREGLHWVEALYPDHLSPEDALCVFGKVQWCEEDGPLRYAILLQRTNTAARKALLQALVDSLPHPWRDGGEAGMVPAWKTRLIEELADQLIEDEGVGEGDAPLIAEVLYCLYWLAEREMIHEPEKIWQKTRQHLTIRRTYYWLCWERRTHSKWAPYHWMMNIVLGGGDLIWLLEDVMTAPDHEARQFAQGTAVGLLMGRESRKAYGRGMCHLLIHFPSLMLRVIYSILLVRWRRFTLRRVGWGWRSFSGRMRDRWVRLNNWAYIREQILRIRQGRADGLLCRLVERPYCSSKDWRGFWNEMKNTHGRLVVWAIRQRSKSLWRKDSPPYYCEMEKPGRILLIYGGLVGIHESIESGELDLNNLSSREVESLFRYSIYDWNGYPEWFGSFVRKHDALVAGQIEYCLNKEWIRPDADDTVLDMFQRLQFAEGGLIKLAIPHLIRLVEGGEPATKRVLEMAWRIILNNSMGISGGDLRLSALVANKLPHYDQDSKTYAYALITWLYADLNSALEYVEAQENADPANVRKRMHAIFAEYGDRSNDILARLWRNESNCTEEPYVRYLRLLYRCVHPAADVPTPKGCFSPEGPWAAQEYRSHTFSYIDKGKSAEAGDLLKKLAEDPDFAAYSDWFLSMRDMQLRLRADQLAWGPRNIAEFANAFVASPKNDFDLYRIACDRLYDIKHLVEKSDMSPRKEVRSDENEAAFREWLSRKLSESNMTKYDIAQEPVLDQERRRDIRVSHPNIKGPVTIEIKKAGEWSGNKLFERLENQLFGQYLRDPDARYGVYLLGYFGLQEHWQYDGRDLNWVELIVELQVKADELAKMAGKGGEVRVVGIDFRKPS